jgi:hypothetical protein
MLLPDLAPDYLASLPGRLPGFRRAGPSTPLDKSVANIYLLGTNISYLKMSVKILDNRTVREKEYFLQSPSQSVMKYGKEYGKVLVVYLHRYRTKNASSR